MGTVFRNEKMETLPRPELEQFQLKHLQSSVNAALKTPFYSKRLEKSNIKDGKDIQTLEDIGKIPFTTKEDLRRAYPKGLLAVEMADVVRLHSSSGTTGIPTVIYHTQADLDDWSELVSRCLAAIGGSKHDVFQNMMTYGLFTGGLGLHYGAERLGMLVIPSSSGNTRRQLDLMRDFSTSIVHATPSYMLHMFSKLADYGVDVSELNIKKAIVGGEPYSDTTRAKIEAMYGIDVYNNYGLSEMNGPGVGVECEYKNGMHIWEDSYILEIIDPETLEPITQPGIQGEVVFTCIKRQATPILRYRTKDLAYILEGKCPCGRTHKRLSRIMGRTDDMLIVNGVNIFPSQIEQVVMDIPEVGTNYQIYLYKQGALDKMVVRVEIYSKLFHGEMSELKNLKARIREQIKSSVLINAEIELHEPGALPAFELKAKRVVDERPKL